MRRRAGVGGMGAREESGDGERLGEGGTAGRREWAT